MKNFKLFLAVAWLMAVCCGIGYMLPEEALQFLGLWLSVAATTITTVWALRTLFD